MVLFAGQTMRTYELTHICLSLVDRIAERRKKLAHHQIQIRLHFVVVVRGGGGRNPGVDGRYERRTSVPSPLPRFP